MSFPKSRKIYSPYRHRWRGNVAGIALFIIVVVFVSFFYALVGNGNDPEHIRKEATNYLRTMNYDVLGFHCVDQDTDGDGYVSCSANVRGMTAPVAFECASSFSFNSGCRVPKPVSPYGW